MWEERYTDGEHLQGFPANLDILAFHLYLLYRKYSKQDCQGLDKDPALVYSFSLLLSSKRAKDIEKNNSLFKIKRFVLLRHNRI